MAQTEHLPIYKSAYDMCLYIEKIVLNFSRYHKYSIGADLREGTRVVVTREPLEGTVGSIVERYGKHKLRVSIELIKRSVYVDIEADDVEVLQ